MYNSFNVSAFSDTSFSFLHQFIDTNLQGENMN